MTFQYQSIKKVKAKRDFEIPRYDDRGSLIGMRRYGKGVAPKSYRSKSKKL